MNATPRDLGRVSTAHLCTPGPKFQTLANRQLTVFRSAFLAMTTGRMGSFVTSSSTHMSAFKGLKADSFDKTDSLVGMGQLRYDSTS